VTRAQIVNGVKSPSQIVNGMKSPPSGFEIDQRTTPTKTITANEVQTPPFTSSIIPVELWDGTPQTQLPGDPRPRGRANMHRPGLPIK
jgi:hypothetical protein